MPKKEERVQYLAPKSLPTFKEYRAKDDVVMKPDRGFMKQLKKLDDEYEVMWDWSSEKWEIWRFPKEFGKEPFHITTVQTKNRSYRELGADVLLMLQATSWDRFTAKQLGDYLDELDTQVMRRKAKKMRTVIEDITRDTRTYVMCKFIQIPKEYKIGRVVANATE